VTATAAAAGRLLEGRRAVITGAASGIGAAIALRYCEHGAAVAIADLDPAAGGRLAGELRDAGHFAVSLAVDVTDEPSTRRMLEDAGEALGGLDIVVANAGIIAMEKLAAMESRTFRAVLDVNVVGAFHTFKHALAQLEPGGVLLATASLAARQGSAELSAYCASKFAVVGLVEALAQEVGDRGLRVCAVAPGMVDTPMLPGFVRKRAEARGEDAETTLASIAASGALGRLADPLEVGDAFVYLASPLASYVTGAVLGVDGGSR
jgi:NAD(P)-dependent dehydrogenase (short-subunit alcohol dehydrogenase family)